MVTTAKQKTCAELISARYADRLEQFNGACGTPLDEPSLAEYVAENTLAFDFVKGNTFKNQPDGYWRLQLSWGGPSDEIRYYKADRSDKKTYDQITYVYMDWFDGAEIQVHDEVWGYIFDRMWFEPEDN